MTVADNLLAGDISPVLCSVRFFNLSSILFLSYVYKYTAFISKCRAFVLS